MIQGVDWLGSVNTGYKFQGFGGECLFTSASTISGFILDFTLLKDMIICVTEVKGRDVCFFKNRFIFRKLRKLQRTLFRKLWKLMMSDVFF